MHYSQINFLRTEIMQSLVADGNFTANHIKQQHPQDDIWISDGEDMMMARELYTTHIKLAKDTKDVGHIYYLFDNLLTGSVEDPLQPIREQFQGYS